MEQKNPRKESEEVPVKKNEDNSYASYQDKTKPDVHIVRKIEYYKVYGNSSEELLNEIRTKGPKIGEGIYDASLLPLTYFELPCNGTPTVTLDLTYTYPQWERPAVVDPETAETWNSYLYALDVHEKGHEEISLEAARKTLDALYNIPYNEDCDAQLQQAKSIGGKIVDEGYLKNVEYDRITDHGYSQDAY